MWPKLVKDQALAGCGRRCCVCQNFCGTNMELHHIQPEADGGASTLENCIPLCLDCHSEVGHYNSRHPKGTKYRSSELRMHRDAWFKAMASAERLKHIPSSQVPALPKEVYEGQSLQFKGYLFQQTFTGPPNYEDFRADALENCFLLTLPESFRFNYEPIEPIESASSEMIVVPRAQVLHLILKEHQFSFCKERTGGDVSVTGRLWPCINGHHRGDALIEVDSLD
ncbi:HNH endonuclease [Pseudomonas xanthosomatis]|uniref:HNH endonuclease n=1 Tax=Pseudomonas xanthosomatis TaxID=2842356 RepID=UPI0035126CF3